MIITTDYDNKHILLRESSNLNAIKNEPVRCNHLAFLFVKSGEIKIELNYTIYNAKADSVLFLSPLDIVTLKDCSSDYSSTVLFVPASLITEHTSFLKLDFNFFEKIKRYPHINLYGKELDVMNKILDTLHNMHELFEYENFEKSALSTVSMIFQLYHHYFKKNAGLSGGMKNFDSRKKTLFRKFVKEIIASHSKSREVLYYANELGVSSGYLNEVCNEVSGYSAKEIIDTAVSSRLKYELSYTDKSIQELADEYNFPSQSYFSRYYKRLTGLSPSDFRKKR